MRLMKLKNKVCLLIVSFLLIFFLSYVQQADAWSGKLSQGMKGTEVMQLQQKLQELLYNPGQIDGSYGYQTEQAVQAFQKKHGLVVDGVAGWRTLNEIDRVCQQQQNPVVSRGGSWSRTRFLPTLVSNNDLYLLSKAIYAEARGESYEGQVAVGAVILNRLKDKSYPKSIAEIIYQPRQFDAVYDGQINLEPNQKAINAAQDALSGWDPTNGALFYYNPRYTNDQWIRTRSVIKSIGSHIFAK